MSNFLRLVYIRLVIGSSSDTNGLERSELRMKKDDDYAL